MVNLLGKKKACTVFDQPIDLLHCNMDASIVHEINLSRGLLLRSKSFFGGNSSSTFKPDDWSNFSPWCAMFEAACVRKTSHTALASSEEPLTSDHSLIIE